METRVSEKLPVFLVIGILGMACSNISIDSYTPGDPNEKEIVLILKQYRNSRNAYDLKNFLSCLHPSGNFSFMGNYVLSKSSLEKKLPRFWNRLKREDATIYPIMRESITGDFFGTWAFYNPRISINGDSAKVTMICSSSWICSQYHFLSLKKENGKWLISETAWYHF